MGRARRFALGLARVLLWTLPVVAGVATLVGGGAFFWLRSADGNAWLLAQALSRIQPTNGAITAEGVDTDLLNHLTLRGVELCDPGGVVLIRVDAAEAELDTQSLLGRVLPIHELTLSGVAVNLADPAVLSTMWPTDPAVPAKPWTGLPFDLLVEHARLDGTVAIGSFAADVVALDVGIEARGKQVAWHDLGLSATTAAGPLTATSAGVWSPDRSVIQALTASLGDAHANRVEVTGAVNGGAVALDLPVVHFDKDGLTALLPALASLPLVAPVDAAGRVTGTAAHPSVTVLLTTPGGAVAVSGDVDLGAKRWVANVDTASFDTAAVLSGIEPAHLVGSVSATGTGWTWPGDLTADATVDAALQARRENLRVRGPVHVEAGQVTLNGVAANLGWARGTASGDVDVLGKAGHFDVNRASARLARFGVGGDAGFDGTVDVTWGDAVTVGVRGDVSGTGIVSNGATISHLTGKVNAGWADNHPNGRADFTLGELAWRDRHARSGEVHVELGETVAAAVTLREKSADVARLAGSFHLHDRRVSLSEVWLLLAPGLELQAEGEQHAMLVPGGVADARLRVRVGDATVEARGGVSAHGRDTLVVDLDTFNLSYLELMAPGTFSGWAGTVTAHVGLVGTLDAPALEGVVQVQGLSLPDQVEGLRAQLAFQGDGQRMHLDGFAGDATTDLLVLTSDLPLQLGRDGARLAGAGPLDAHLTLAPVDLATLSDLLAGRTLPDARLSADVALSGTSEAPVLRLVSSADLPLAPKGPTARVWLDAALAEGVVTARLVLNQEFQARMETVVASRLDVDALTAWAAGQRARPDPHDLFSEFGGAILLKQLPIATIRRFVAFRGDVDGALAGAFALSGSPFAPRLQGGINVVGARVGRLAVEPATLDLTPLPAGYRVDATLGFAALTAPDGTAATGATCAAKAGDPAGRVQLSGLVPLDATFSLDRPGLALELTGSGVPLAAAEAFVPALAETSGCLNVSGSIGGSLREPKLALGINLSSGSSILAPLGVRLEDITINGRFQDDLLVIDRARVHTSTGLVRLDAGAGGGLIDASGRLRLVSWVPSELTATVTFDRAWLTSTADRRARVSGKLDVKGQGSNVDVTGNVSVDEGYLHLPQRFFSGTQSTELHPDIEVIRPGATVLAVATGDAAPWVINVRPKLEIDLARHVRLAADLPLQGGYGDLARSLSTVSVETELDGTLKVSKKLDQLRLTGEVNTERGMAQVFGRPFEISDGTIAFTGADYKQPILAVHAIHHTTCNGESADINVEIGGVPSAPTLEFPTDGSGNFPDTDSVLRALILGSCEGTSADSGAEASTLPLLTELLKRQVASYGSSSGESLFHLEKLELDSSGAARIGIALGRNVFLTYEYDPMAATTGGNTSAVQVELSLPYRWYLAVETGTEGNTSASAYRKWRF